MILKEIISLLSMHLIGSSQLKYEKLALKLYKSFSMGYQYFNINFEEERLSVIIRLTSQAMRSSIENQICSAFSTINKVIFITHTPRITATKKLTPHSFLTIPRGSKLSLEKGAKVAALLKAAMILLGTRATFVNHAS